MARTDPTTIRNLQERNPSKSHIIIQAYVGEVHGTNITVVFGCILGQNWNVSNSEVRHQRSHDIVTDQRPALVEEPVEIVIDEPKVIGQPEIKINSFELE